MDLLVIDFQQEIIRNIHYKEKDSLFNNDFQDNNPTKWDPFQQPYTTS